MAALEPAYRAHFPDGSTLDVIADTARMAGEISRVCGACEADGYLRFVEHARRLWQLERRDFIERNLDSPRALLTANLLRLAAAGGFGRLQPKLNRFFRNPRTRRVFSFRAMYAGLAPHEALGLYAVIPYLDSVSGVYFPRGGVHAVPRALAAAAVAHGVELRYRTTVSRVETAGDRATAVVTEEQRGYGGFAAGIEVSHVVTPAEWAAAGMAAGTPFAAAHTLWQTGPFRPRTLHDRLGNVVFVGSGTQPGVGVPMVLISGKLAAQRITATGGAKVGGVR